MTHSAYRQGTYSTLCDDFVVRGYPWGDRERRSAALDRFIEIGSRHEPVHIPGSAPWAWALVYDSKEKLRGFLADLVAADIGLSVTVTGLRDQVWEVCHSVGLSPHTVLDSFGFWGKIDRLPPFNVLEITTMCGHGRVPPNLVCHLARQIQAGRTRPEEAANRMSQLCLCGIFNEARAARLIRGLAADLEAGTILEPQYVSRTSIPPKSLGVTIDEAACNSCGACVPYCPVSAIVEYSADNTISIDPRRCTECGLCLQSEVCPVHAVVARDLTWPRTLRGKFQNRHSPYRNSRLLAQVSPPLKTASEGETFNRSDSPTELRNDVNGLIRHGEAEIIAELGRPHLSTTFRDVQKVVQALLPLGLQLEHQYPPADQRSPLSELAAVASRGVFKPDILDERAGWVTLRLLRREEELPRILLALRRAAAEIDTVFAVGVVSRLARDGSTAAETAAREIGLDPAVNCKTNVGLGRPLSP